MAAALQPLLFREVRRTKEEAQDAWRDALEIGREDGKLEEME